MSLENIPFKILLIKKHIPAQARSFRGGDNSLVPEQKVVGSQAAEYGVCIWNHEKKGVEQVKMLI
jgi:hypothetical protein